MVPVTLFTAMAAPADAAVAPLLVPLARLIETAPAKAKMVAPSWARTRMSALLLPALLVVTLLSISRARVVPVC